MTTDERQTLRAMIDQAQRARQHTSEHENTGCATRPQERSGAGGLSTPGMTTEIPKKDWPKLLEQGKLPYAPIRRHFCKKFGWDGAESQFATPRVVRRWRAGGMILFNTADKLMAQAGCFMDWYTNPELRELYENIVLVDNPPCRCHRVKTQISGTEYGTTYKCSITDRRCDTLDLECRNCGKEFDSYSTRKFCSRKCIDDHNSKLRCAQCGRYLKQGHPGRRFCSSYCRGKAGFRRRREGQTT